MVVFVVNGNYKVYIVRGVFFGFRIKIVFGYICLFGLFVVDLVFIIFCYIVGFFLCGRLILRLVRV